MFLFQFSCLESIKVIEFFPNIKYSKFNLLKYIIGVENKLESSHYFNSCESYNFFWVNLAFCKNKTNYFLEDILFCFVLSLNSSCNVSRLYISKYMLEATKFFL